MTSLLTFILITLIASVGSTYVQFNSPIRDRVFARRCAAALFLAGPPLLLSIFAPDAGPFGLALTRPFTTLWIATALIVAAILVNAFAAGSEQNLREYPQLRVNHWGFGLFMQNALSWSVYMVAYEYLLRGYFLFTLIEKAGLVWAIVLNITLYSALHIPKGARETILALPFGILLCMITWYTGNIWSAVAIHLALALSNDYFAIRRNPGMNIAFSFSNKLKQ